MSKSKHKFQLATHNEKLSGILYLPVITSDTQVLFLHGAGTADKTRIQYIAKFLLNKNISSLSFDFSGHGESTGKLGESSLQKRVEEARNAAEFLDYNKEITLVGSSMGAHIAIQLLQYKKVANLILFCPAVYSKDAENVRFDSGFSEIIRKHDSWKTSTCFSLLRSFTENLLIIIGEEDTVIPKEVVNTVIESSPNAKSKEVLFIPKAGHQLHTYIQNHRTMKAKAFEKIEQFLNNTS